MKTIFCKSLFTALNLHLHRRH